MFMVHIVAYQQMQRRTDFTVKKLRTITDTFLSLVASIRDMELLVKVCCLTRNILLKVNKWSENFDGWSHRVLSSLRTEWSTLLHTMHYRFPVLFSCPDYPIDKIDFPRGS